MVYNHKGKGIRFERRVKALLESQGFFCIRQSASQFPDLVAINGSAEVYFIECKMNKYISSQERAKLRELSKYGTPVIATLLKHEVVFLDLNYKNPQRILT